jgi:hypothetical protein
MVRLWRIRVTHVARALRLERRSHAAPLATWTVAELIIWGIAHLMIVGVVVVIASTAAASATTLGSEVSTTMSLALDRMVRLSSEMGPRLLRSHSARVRGNRSLSHMALSIASEAAKCHLATRLL